jgi:peroxiredoxin Q/BCP
MKLVILTITLMLAIIINGFSQEKSLLKVGDKAPMFKAVTDKGSVWFLKDYIGEKNIIVYFYPAAMTGGCTKQARAYSNFQSDLESADAIVVGISGDNVEGLKIFKEANDINFTLLADPTGKIAQKYGVDTRDGGTITVDVNSKSLDLVRGVTDNRTTFIIGKNGKIIYANDQVDPHYDVKNVLEFLRNK